MYDELFGDTAVNLDVEDVVLSLSAEYTICLWRFRFHKC